MYIEYQAIWYRNPEEMKDFYLKYFAAIPNEQYHNLRNHFSSYFLGFAKDPRLELMRMPEIPDSLNDVLAQFS